MKASAIHLRWYKSFNINYLGYDDRQPEIISRPWNEIASTSASAYRFIEIPLRSDVTTIVGANESGKSQLLSALKQVVTGVGIPDSDGTESEFSVTDLCHYSSIRDKNALSWPNIGATFSDVSGPERSALAKAAGVDAAKVENINEITLVLAHAENQEALLYFGRTTEGTSLDKAKLKAVRELLPKVAFIQSDVPLAGELPIDDLLSGCKTKDRYYGFKLAQEAARLLQTLTFGEKNSLTDAQAASIRGLCTNLKAGADSHLSVVERKLALQLFHDVLGIEPPTLELLADVKPKERGFAEGLVATWNQELDRKLNLRRFWQQDDQFSLSLDYKGGWFEWHCRE